MSAVLPKNLALIVQRLANFNRQTIRVRAQSNDQAEPGQTIVFRLPTNTLIDLHNLQFLARVKTVGKRIEAGVAQDVYCSLPMRSQCMIESLDVVVNGQTITGSNRNYGGLYHLLSTHLGFRPQNGGGNHAWMTRDVLEPIETQMLQNGNPVLSPEPPELPGAAERKANILANYMDRYLLMEGFMGFLSGYYVRFIDTATTGPIEIRIRLMPRAVLTKHPNQPANAYSAFGYTFGDMYLVLDTISFTDDFYRQILARRLIDGGVITIPYPNFFNFQKSFASTQDTISFNLATQSLDYLLGTMRLATHAADVPKALNTFNNEYFRYVSGAATTAAGHEASFPNATYQFLINNMHYPTWPANVTEAEMLTKAAFDLAGDVSAVGSLQTRGDYRDENFAFVQCLKHHSETEKIISGLDTRGAASNMQFMLSNMVLALANNLTVPYVAEVFAMCTSTIEISAGQNVTVIF